MKLKEKNEIGELKKNLQVVLNEALAAAHELSHKAKQFRSLRPISENYAGRYGELAAQAFLLKLKADALHETLEEIIEEQSDEN